MNSTDWRDILGATLSDDDRSLLAQEAEAAESVQSPKLTQKGSLKIIVERKGRAGKTATIICGFTVSDSRLKEIATSLRQKLGCGGSSRDSEILLQGDRREAAKRHLSALGFKVK